MIGGYDGYNKKRITSDWQVVHRAKIRLKGYPPQTATFQRLTDAKKWVQHTEVAIREGRYFKIATAKKHTLAETIDRYCENILTFKANSTENQRHYLKWWKQEIGSYLLADITPALLIEYRSQYFYSNGAKPWAEAQG